MSHTATVKTEIKDIPALKRACTALKIPFVEGHQKVELYSGTVTADFSFQLKDWDYPVAFLKKEKEFKFDNFNGHWGDPARLEELQQEYGLQVVEKSEDVQQFVMEGWNIQREKQKNGDVHVVLTR